MSRYTFPAIRGKMGSTTYYQCVMRADELQATVRAAMDFQEFKNFMAHEKMQRPMNEERVERTIVPYLLNSPDRFFGSIIVLVYQPQNFVFESLGEISGESLPAAYRHLRSDVGSLTIEGGKLFALDGQHRLHALRTIIQQERTRRLGIPIKGPYRDEIKSDQLSVIFLPFEGTQKARRIFNKVNRYAKPTSTSTNILTSEDDGIYIITRCVASLDNPTSFDSEIEPPIPATMTNGSQTVQLEGSSIKQGAPHLFTLELLSKAISAMCVATKQPPLDETDTIVRPPDDVLREAYEECSFWWSALIESFDPFRIAMARPDDIPSMRGHEERYSVAMRPNGQEALIRGLMEAHRISGVGAATLVQRLNKLPLSLTHDVWLGVLLSIGAQRRRVIGYTSLASELVTYMLVGPSTFGARKTQTLLENYEEARSQGGLRKRALPKPVL